MIKLYKVQISIFINIVLLEHTMSIHLHIVYGCFCAITAELNSYNRLLWPENPNIFTIWPFTEKVCCPYSREKNTHGKKRKGIAIDEIWRQKRKNWTKWFLSCVPITGANSLLSSHMSCCQYSLRRVGTRVSYLHSVSWQLISPLRKTEGRFLKRWEQEDYPGGSDMKRET